jgi:hypothetical protein
MEVCFGSERSLQVYFLCIELKKTANHLAVLVKFSDSNDHMLSFSKSNFSKNEDCPSSQELLDFQNGEIEREQGVDIRIHMSVCEFCSAEVDFYSHYPTLNDEPINEPAEIPAPLFELAEALLKNRQADGAALNMLWNRNERHISR